MKKTQTYIRIGIGAILLGLLGYFLQTQLAYLFFYREQEDLFLWNSTLIVNQLQQIGGFATLCGQFAVQFFAVPKLGALLTTILLGLTSYLLWLTMKKSPHADFAFTLSFLPITFEVILLTDANFHYDGIIAILLIAFCLFINSRCKFKKVKDRFFFECGLAILLLWAAGPASLLFCISLLCIDFKDSLSKSIILLLICALAYISVLTVETNGFRFAFLPDAYYESALVPDKILLMGWLSLPASLLLSRLSAYGKAWNKVIRIGLSVIILLFLGYNTIAGTSSYLDKKFYQLMKFQYLEANGQWDELIQVCIENSHNYLYGNYQNLALAHKGELMTHLFDYPQNGPLSLFVVNNKSKEITQLLSQIYFFTGNVAAAQNMAFESNTGCTGSYNPRMMKLLVQTNLIFGAYPVAEKYIHLLEQSWRYRQWASSQRKFLYNDRAVENDSLLGMKRKDIPRTSDFIYLNGVPADLEHTIQANPDEKSAVEYMEAYLLLAKDMKGIKYMVEKYGGTNILRELPTLLQEAVISYAENDPVYCTQHGVTEITFERYRDFKQKFIECRNSGRNPADVLHAEYGNSFWYYLMFKQ